MTVNARFAALYTGAIIDVLDDLGLRSQALPHGLRPLDPALKLSGKAYAVEGRAAPDLDREESITSILAMLSAVPDGHVAAYQSNDDTCAHLGELSVAALKVSGAVGAVMDGGCRDIGHILDERFPVYCRYTTPLDAVGRWEVVRHGHEVVIGDVPVATGDQLVGDRDGVVVVPAAVIDEVLARAEALAGTEDVVRDAVRAGVSPLDAYRQHGVF